MIDTWVTAPGVTYAQPSTLGKSERRRLSEGVDDSLESLGKLSLPGTVNLLEGVLVLQHDARLDCWVGASQQPPRYQP